jgi:hypothetical protein
MDVRMERYASTSTQILPSPIDSPSVSIKSIT